MCRSRFGSRAEGGWCEVGEGERLDGVVGWAGNLAEILGGDVEGEVEEGLAVGFDEGGEAVLVRFCSAERGGRTDAIQSALSCSGNPASKTHSPAEY